MPNHDFTQATALYVPGFRANFNLVPQLSISNLMDACDYDDNFDAMGEYWNTDWIGTSDPQDQNARIPEVQYKEMYKERRFGVPKPYNDAVVIEDIDKIKENAEDPQGKIVAAMRAGRERRTRRTIIAAVFGNGMRRNDDGTTTSIALPSSQVIASTFAELHEDESPTAVGGKYPMTFGKFLEAMRRLDDANIPAEGRIFMTSSYQLQKMALSKVGTQSFYMQNLKAILAGETDMLGGVKIKKITGKGDGVTASGLPLNTSTNVEKSALYHKDAIQYRGKDIKALRVQELERYGYRTGVYYERDAGAVRTNEESVVEIDNYRDASAA